MTTTWEDIRGPLATGFAEGAMNLIGIGMTNRANSKINERNLEYNTAMTQQQWERDDNAHQREVADLKAAGLSPLASVTGANVSSALGAPNPIAMQAPQFDVNSFLNSAIQNKQLNEIERHNRAQEGYESDQIINQLKEIANKEEELRLQGVKFTYDFKIASKQLELTGKQLDEVSRHNKESESNEQKKIALQKLEHLTKTYYEEINKHTEGGKLPYKAFYGPDSIPEMQAYELEREAAYATLLEYLEDNPTKSTYAVGGSDSSQYGAGLNFPTGPGSSVGGNAQTSQSSSDSLSTSEDYSKLQEEVLRKWHKDWPVAIYFDYNYEEESKKYKEAAGY